jgi:hypothetical protein
VTLELPALSLVRGSVFQVRPVLVVRCRDKELEVFVLTGSALDSNDSVTTPVRVHWGTGTGDDSRWNRSTDGKSAFTPDPRGFLRQLVDAPDLRLEVHPAGGSPQLIRFNARGIDRHVVQVNSVCPVRRI